jgi:hypothetical protein
LSTGRVRGRLDSSSRWRACCGRPATSSAGGAVSGGSRRRRACGARRAAGDPRHGQDVAGRRLPMTCAVRRPGWTFSPSPFVPLYRTDDESPPSCRPHHSRGYASGLGRAGQRRLPGPDGRLRQTPRPGSAPPTWPSSSRSVTSSSTRHSCATSNERGTAGFPRPSAQLPDHPRHTEWIIPMSDAVAAATQLHPASPREGADRFIPTGSDGVLALGHTSAAASRLRSPT